MRLADDGFDIGINDRAASDKLTSLEAEIVAKGRKCSVHVADVSVQANVSQMVDEVVSFHGGLDVVSDADSPDSAMRCDTMRFLLQMVANAGVSVWVPFLESEWFEHLDQRVTVIGAKKKYGVQSD